MDIAYITTETSLSHSAYLIFYDNISFLKQLQFFANMKILFVH
jgi:hypothetical protein